MDLLKLINSFLEYEDENDLLSFKFDKPNIHLWLLIRYNLLSYTISKKLILEQPHTFSNGTSIKSRIRSLLYSILLNPLFIKKKFLIVFLNWTSDTTGVLMKNKFFNKRDDYFGSVFPNETVFLEQSIKGEFKYPRHHKNVFNRDLIDTLPKVAGYFIKPKTSDLKTINEFITYLEKTFPYELEENYLLSLKHNLLNQSKRLPYKKKLFYFLIKKFRPELVVVQNASYGHTAYYLKWLKELKIKTAEFQHGTITKGHVAYNYADNLLKNELFKEYIPDYLLTFGEFWNEQTNTPATKVVIGSPHISEKLKTYEEFSVKNDNIKIISIISQGSITNKMVNLCIGIAGNLNAAYRIIYRLHPGEVGFTERYAILKSYPNIEISSKGDIYDVFAKSDIIIGCYSTALFEAAAFNKPIYILDNNMSNAYIPKDFGIWIKDDAEFIDLLNTPMTYKDSSFFWSTNWQSNYKRFINTLIYEKSI